MADITNTFWTISDGDYYVSTIGNDITGTGTPQNPFLTVARALDQSQEDAPNGNKKIVVGPNEYIIFNGENVTSGASADILLCRAATQTNITLSSAGLPIVDGIQLVANDVVLVKSQNVPAQNGVYVVVDGAWTRHANYITSEDVVPEKLLLVLHGTASSNTFYLLTTVGAVSVGVTPITYSKVNGTKWGDISGNIANQTDLANALATKATPKGLIDCLLNPNYPAGVLGDYYYVSVAGKIGGAAGLEVSVGTRIECIVAQSAGGDEATVGSEWIVMDINLGNWSDPVNSNITVALDSAYSIGTSSERLAHLFSDQVTIGSIEILNSTIRNVSGSIVLSAGTTDSGRIEILSSNREVILANTLGINNETAHNAVLRVYDKNSSGNDGGEFKIDLETGYQTGTFFNSLRITESYASLFLTSAFGGSTFHFRQDVSGSVNFHALVGNASYDSAERFFITAGGNGFSGTAYKTSAAGIAISRPGSTGTIGEVEIYTANGVLNNDSTNQITAKFKPSITEILNNSYFANNIGVGTSSYGTNASKVLAISNGTAPTSSPANLVQLYAEDVSASSELKVRDEAGNITTLSPHNFSLIPDGPSEEMAWSYYSEKDGKAVNIDMAKLARLVEKLTGEKLVFIQKLKKKSAPKVKSVKKKE